MNTLDGIRQREHLLPLVSVCMPTYNHENYIEEAINGVLEQKGCNIELIIANDYSSDNTLCICEKYQNLYPEKIQLISQPYNKGLVENTKECLFACSGKYIAICEGDDYWIHPFKLQKQISVLENDPTITLVHTNWTDYYQSEGKKRESARINNNNLVCEIKGGQQAVEAIINDEYSIRFSSVCFRKKILIDIYKKDPFLFNNRYTTLDVPLFMDFAFEGKLFFINEDHVMYRLLDESVSITKDIHKSTKFIKGCLYIYIHYVEKYQMRKSIKDTAIRRSLSSLLPYAFKYKDVTLAEEIKREVNKIGYKMRVGQYLCYWGCKNRLVHFLLSHILFR